MRKTFVQGGSVKVFVIVGIILALLALTTLYFVKKNSYSQDVPPMVVPEGIADGTDSEKPEKTENQDDSTTGGKDDETKPQDTANGSSDAQSGDDAKSDSTDQQSSGSDSAATADSLPQTGPSDSLATMIAVIALSVSTAAYVRSRAS